MDADDRAHPDRLARQVHFLDRHPQVGVAGCLVSGFPPELVGEGSRLYLRWLNSLVTDADIRREIFIESPFAHPSVIFRRDWVEQVGGYQERGWAEDYDLWLRLAQAGARFAKVPEILLEWRETPQRLTRTNERYSLDNFLRAKAYYLKHGPLAGREPVFIWGAGTAGKRLGRYLQQDEVPLAAYVDVDPRKIGRTRRGLPVLSPQELRIRWERSTCPALIAAVGARGARPIIRERLSALGLVEGQDWWFAA
jgi:GT2 family glycosyltransferase